MRLSFDEVRLILWSVRTAPRRADVPSKEVATLIARLQREYERQEKRRASEVCEAAADDGGGTQPAA